MKLLSFLVCASLIYCAPPFPYETDKTLFVDNFELKNEMTRIGVPDQLSNDDVSEECTGRVSCLPFKPVVAAHNMLTYVGNAAKSTLAQAHKTIKSQGDRILEKLLFHPTYPDYEWVSENNHFIHDVPVDPDIDGKDDWYMNMMKPRSIFNLETNIYDPDQNQKWDKVLLFFSGNCMDMRLSSTTLKETIFGKGFRKIFVEYPGYGTLRDVNGWTASPENFVLSARAITSYLVRELNIDPSKIIVVGYSLGSGSATEAAFGLTKYSELSLNRTDGGLFALILVAPFYKMQLAANHATQIGGYLVNEKFKNYKNIIEITCPTLLVHGYEDQVLSARHTKMLSNAQISKDRQQVSILPRVGHLIIDSVSVQRLMREFLKKYEQEEI
jgi:pimeloyl-ACP methyl ester carboxylesterase